MKSGQAFPNESVLLEKNKAKSKALGDTGRKKVLMKDGRRGTSRFTSWVSKRQRNQR